MATAAAADVIEKSIVLKAPRSRVWRALAEAGELGSWFGADLEGQAFVPGARVAGRITHPGYEHLDLELVVERVEPERLLSWRWHPYAVDAAVDYSAEPDTLVTFELEDAEGGTRLRVTESGFLQVPPARRDEAYRMNEDGWTQQMRNIADHLDR
jgi:uncharacterized protein YndB with AHSA1/START domain